jgi:methylphosphotriester-DNA--protein-cysteine methyltransferase
MADDITNTVLLQHIQAMKGALETQMQAMKVGLESQMQAMKSDLTSQISALDAKMQAGFEEARQHREALQEDLEATMKVLSKHERKLARLSS